MSGQEWVVDAYGCDAAALADLGKLRGLFARMIEELSLRPVGETKWHQFPSTGGITGLCLLAESHLACHTFPEYGSLCLNLFCCKPRPEWEFTAYLEREFAARSVRIRRLERPYQIDEHSRELPELRRADPLPLV
ncbi:MAG: S-adenosylmethionine decarboxylase [Bryobacteraceae bacterium]|jgi:S-adenosylmethionine decarboxylase